jgi:lipopolysaccharide heptosyltransferase I
MLRPMERTVIRLSESDRLLVIRLGAVGDVLRTLPALHHIRSSFAPVHISWIVEDPSHEILEGHPEIDGVIRFPRREIAALAHSPHRLVSRIRALGRELRQERFTVALDFQGSFKSGLLALLSGAPVRLGFAPGHSREMSSLFTNRWMRPSSRWMNRVERNLLLSEAVGATGNEVTMILPEIQEDGGRAEAILRDVAPAGEPVILLSPGTSRLQSYKRWPAERFARLAERLRDTTGAVPLVAWGPGEEDLAAGIVQASGGAAILAPPIRLRPLASLLRRCALFVGADTGPMHLAWGVGCPVVALFGPTDPRLNSPLGPDHVVLRGDRSITGSISSDEVLGAVRGLLKRSSRRHSAAPPRLLRSNLFRDAAGVPA